MLRVTTANDGERQSSSDETRDLDVGGSVSPANLAFIEQLYYQFARDPH